MATATKPKKTRARKKTPEPLIHVNKETRAWAVWIVAALFLFYKTMIEVSPAIMKSQLIQVFGMSSAQVGWVAASYFVAYFLMQIPAALLLDKLGSRFAGMMALLLCSIGSILFSVAHSFAGVYVGRFISGVGASFALLNCVRLVAQWFKPSQFAMMAGAMMTIGMLGAFFGIAPFAAFITETGFRSGLDTFSMVGILFVALFWIFAKDGKPLKKKTPLVKTQLKQMLNPKGVWRLAIYSGLAFTPVGVFGALWGVSYLESIHSLTYTTACWMLSVYFLGFALVAPLVGWFSDRIHSRKKIALHGTASALVALCLILYIPNINSAILGGLLFLYGAMSSTYLISFAMMRDSQKPHLVPLSIAFMTTLNAFAIAFWDPITGWWSELSHPRLALTILPLSLLLALICMYGAKETYKQETSTPEMLP